MQPTQLHRIQWECQQLLNRINLLMDAGRWDELAACYAEDGVLYRPSDPNRGVEGRDAILASFRARPPRTTCHVLANSVFEVHSSTRVTATSRVLLFSAEGAGDLPAAAGSRLLIGSFVDELDHHGDHWVVRKRLGSVELTYDYA